MATALSVFLPSARVTLSKTKCTIVYPWRMPVSSLPLRVHFRRSDVGVNGNGGVFAFTLRVAALRQIYRRFFAPVGFIPIIRVFLYLTVESYQAFCVLCKDVGAVVHRCAEVEHVPKIGSKNHRMVGNYAPLIFVKLCLIFFRVIVDPKR